ncbi:hypothetical protein LUZ60_002866 [Juncus effusus]|nr:hypothetical protein LUZ60_002866 [Juncus effusus]
MATSQNKLTTTAITLAIATASIFLSTLLYRKRCKRLSDQVRQLEASLRVSEQKCAAERQGRVRAQQDLRESVTKPNRDESKQVFPMVPIGTVQSCFSTRNGTPRQPLVVPLARARLILNPSRVSAESLEGFANFSHCWILYVFHLNTNLDKMWNDPYRSKLKSKVRVPRLKGGKMGVLATRSPHRPCPIGLSVAKIEAVNGHIVSLSGVDLVDGTPVLDIKPYLHYSDSVRNATLPNWVQEDVNLTVGSVSFSSHFASSLSNCWNHPGRKSLYASCEEFQALIKEVLTWDIRSISQRTKSENRMVFDETEQENNLKEEKLIYHLILEGIDVSYRIHEDSGVLVETADFGNKR